MKTVQLISIAGVVTLAAASCVAAPPAEGRWKPVVFTLDAGLRLGHESNLFHVQRRYESLLDTDTAQYQRFNRMKGPGDTEARATLDLGWRFKHASKRAIALGFRSRQHAFQANEIANYSEFHVEGSFDVTKADTLKLGIDYVPRHFHKNYSYEAFPGISVFDRADERMTTWSLGWKRDWTKKLSTAVGVARAHRDFAEPFDARDEERDEWSLGARWHANKRVSASLSLGGRHATTAHALEQGVVKDRSYDDRTWSLDLDFNLPKHWHVMPSLLRRERDFATKVAADSSRYGRTDRRWVYGLEAELTFKKRWRLAWDVSQLRNDSGRSAASVPSREFDYDDLSVGMTIGFTRP